MKRRLTYLLAVCFIFCLCIGVQAENADDWEFDDDYWAITGYNGPGGVVVMPDYIRNGETSFMSSIVLNSDDTITSLTLSNKMESLNDTDICGCSALTELILPESLMIIGPSCIQNDQVLKEITIPSQVCLIESNSLTFNWEMSKVTFTGECPVFGAGVLSDLSDDCIVYVPDDQYDAYMEAFAKIGMEYEVQTTGQNAIPMQEVRDDENLEIDGNGTITAYNGYNVRLDIPQELNGITVKSIGPNAFESHWYLSYLTVPDTLESIENEAFIWAQRLKYMNFPESLRTIGDRAFQYSMKGSMLELNEGLERIGSEAFDSSYVAGTVTIPEGIKVIEDRAFTSCIFLEELYLPSTLEEIKASAFERCWALNYVYMDSEKAPIVDPTAFTEDNSLEDIDLNSKCTKQEMLDLQSNLDNLGISCRVWRNQNPDVDYIRDNLDTYIENPDGSGTRLLAGYSGEQTNVRPWDSYSMDGVYGDTVGIADGALKGNQTVRYFAVCHNDLFTYIGNEAFADSALETVDLFDSVTTIGEGAFRNCANLTELTIPESVASIGAGAFEGCTSLEQITINCD